MKNPLITFIALVALPLVSFSAAPKSPTASVPAHGGSAIAGGAQTTSTVINASGAYYLASDLVMSADVPAIVINAPDVTLDLNGCTVRFTGGATANGIEIPAVSNIEIRNGSINDVPGDAIVAGNGSGLRIIDVRVTTAGKNGLTSTAHFTTIDRSDFSFCAGLGVYLVYGKSPRITHSRAHNNGQTGISLAQVMNGEVSNCHATDNQRSGISVGSYGSLVLNNVVARNNLSQKSDEGGILLGSSCTARGNSVCVNYINGIYAAALSAVVEGNSIIRTINVNGNESLGTAINGNGGNVLSINNRISPTTNTVIGNVVNGGGNIFF